MAESVDTVNKNINTTTEAVVAMKVAVIAAEKEGADHVCRNVNRGFYAMIHSQISQKMAALRSEIDSRFMRLTQQKKQLAAIRARMQRDYLMISARYAKTFNTLNRSLKQRVMELDRPVMDLVNTDANKVTNRHNLLTSDISIGQEESVKTSQKIAVSALKQRALTTIQSISRFLADANRLEKVTRSILLRKKIDKPSQDLLVPVSILQSNFDASGNVVTQTYVSQLGLSDEACNVIENRVTAAVRNDEFNWVQTPEKEGDIKNQFHILVNNSNLDNRRKQLILQMFENNSYESFNL